jgi:DNA replicative helicase MCM subunit Mcm2 (Cdc46/Mcm family)
MEWKEWRQYMKKTFYCKKCGKKMTVESRADVDPKDFRYCEECMGSQKPALDDPTKRIPL